MSATQSKVMSREEDNLCFLTEIILTYYSNSTIKYRVYKKLNQLSFLVVENNKTIRAPTLIKGSLFLLVKVLLEFQLSLLSIDYLL